MSSLEKQVHGLKVARGKAVAKSARLQGYLSEAMSKLGDIHGKLKRSLLANGAICYQPRFLNRAISYYLTVITVAKIADSGAHFGLAHVLALTGQNDEAGAQGAQGLSKLHRFCQHSRQQV